MLAAVCAAGTTTITNAAREPEIVDLQGFLRAMGAKVHGAGSSVITVEGGVPLHGGSYTVMGDRIVAATYLAAAASAGGTVEVTGVDYRHLSTVTAVLRRGGLRRARARPESIRCAGTAPCGGCGPSAPPPTPAFPPTPRRR